jgi:hypothetical protein
MINYHLWLLAEKEAFKRKQKQYFIKYIKKVRHMEIQFNNQNRDFVCEVWEENSRWYATVQELGKDDAPRFKFPDTQNTQPTELLIVATYDNYRMEQEIQAAIEKKNQFNDMIQEQVVNEFLSNLGEAI